MEQIGVRELRQNASQYLARVAASREPIEITDRGRPVARLVPIVGDEWGNMIAAGEVIPPEAGVDIRFIEPVQWGDRGVEGQLAGTRALNELREHER